MSDKIRNEINAFAERGQLVNDVAPNGLSDPEKSFRVTEKITGKKLEVIFHKTETRFSFIDRLKILLGARLVVASQIYTSEEKVNVIGSKSTGYVEYWGLMWDVLAFYKGKQGYGEVSTENTESFK